MKIILITAGAVKGEVKTLVVEFVKRANAFANVELKELKDNNLYEKKLLELSKKGKLILLDEKGKEFTSKEFADFLQKSTLDAVDLYFAIGPANGFSEEIKQKSNLLFALSKLTIAHELATVFFSEALYRSLSINANHPYHRK